MKLVDAIDLFKRRTFDRLPDCVEKVSLEMVEGNPKYTVLVSDTAKAGEEALLSETLRRLFADCEEVSITATRKSRHVPRFSEYTVMEM